MYIGYTEEQQTLRDELRDYYAKLLTPEVREGLARGQGIGECMREVVKQMGADGWLGIGWPSEYGGQGRTEIEQFIFQIDKDHDGRVTLAELVRFAEERLAKKEAETVLEDDGDSSS